MSVQAWRWPDRATRDAAGESAVDPAWFFNPLHQGIWDGGWVQFRWGGVVEFELSVANVDKPELAPSVLAGAFRASFGDRGSGSLVLRRLPRRRSCFRESTFLVGARYDPAGGEARYYARTRRRAGHRSSRWRNRDVDSVWSMHGGAFPDTGRPSLADDLRFLCDGVPEVEFRRDLSSTQLRPKASGLNGSPNRR